jgi:AcrR family transcriptional regulator
MSDQRPALTPLTPRATEIVSAARGLLEEGGPEALNMRGLADRIGIRAPSLYKHFPDKAALELALIEQAFAEIGTALYAAVAAEQPTLELLRAYRAYATANPNLYRLATAGPLPRERLAPGLEDWAGAPFYLATGNSHRAQALFSFAHGMVILEIDDRFPDDSDLDRTWNAGVQAFASRGDDRGTGEQGASGRGLSLPS